MNRNSLSELSDEELVRLACGTPEDPASRLAAAELLARYRKLVFQWCRRYVSDPEDALDLAQDVLLAAYRNLPSFGERARFSSWLFAIMRNRCLSALRRRAPLVGAEFPLESVAASDTPPDRELELREEETRVRELMARHLTPREQEALWLRYFEQLPVDAITRVLGINGASGARGVLQSARRKLRAALGRTRGTDGALGKLTDD